MEVHPLGRQGVSPWLSVGPGAAEGARLPPMVADSDPAAEYAETLAKAPKPAGLAGEVEAQAE